MSVPTAAGSLVATETSILAVSDGRRVERTGGVAEVCEGATRVPLLKSSEATLFAMGQSAAEILVAGSANSTVTVWGMRDGMPLAVIEAAAAGLEGEVVSLAVQGHMVAASVVGAASGVLIVDVRDQLPGEAALDGDTGPTVVPIVAEALRFGEREVSSSVGVRRSPMFLYMAGKGGALAVGVNRAGAGPPGRLAGESQRAPCTSATGNSRCAVVVRQTFMSIIVSAAAEGDTVVTHVISGKFLDAAVEGDLVVAIHRSAAGCVLTAHAAPTWRPHMQAPVDEGSPICIYKGFVTVCHNSRAVRMRASPIDTTPV